MDTKSTNNGELLLRILIRSGCGATPGLRGNELAKLALAGPAIEQLAGVKLRDIITSLLKSACNRNPLQHSPQNSLPVILEIKSPFSSDTKEKTVSFPKSTLGQ